MAVLCPRCGEYSSILDEHCKKCGFSIKNYLDNRKRFGNVEVKATENSSSSVCVKEETTVDSSKEILDEISNDKSDEIQENIMRLLSNVKIVPDKNKVEENEIIESNVQSVLESALNETMQRNYAEDKVSTTKANKVEKKDVISTPAKKEAVKIVAKKVANDVIILPPNRVKVEIEASKEVAKKDISDKVKDGKVEDKKIEDKKLDIKNVKNDKLEARAQAKSEAEKRINARVQTKSEAEKEINARVQSRTETKAEVKTGLKEIIKSEANKSEVNKKTAEIKSKIKEEIKADSNGTIKEEFKEKAKIETNTTTDRN